jgi:hypothetical protein
MVEANLFQYVKPEKTQPEWISDYEKEIDAAISGQK